MPSNSSRGALAKARTKKWLLDRGYEVADLEKVHWIFTAKGRIPTKKDQWGGDLICCHVSLPNEVTIVQVKSGKAAVGGTFPAARREFAKFVFPSCIKKVVYAWAPRARAPRIVEC